MRKPVSDSNVLVAGVGRNCAATLVSTHDALRKATAGFAERSFLFIESDSEDDTVSALQRGESAGSWRAVSLGHLASTMPKRTERLAHCRNLVVDLVSKEYPAVDYVILADLDGVNSTVTSSAVEDAWSRSESWDVVTANQPGRYYDVWALRHPHWCPGDCWEDFRALRPLIGKKAAREFAVHSRQIELKADLPLIEVDSAFGGLAIYTREAFLTGRYTGLTASGEEVCEHVSYHAELRARGAQIFINPKLLNRVQTEHLAGVTARKTGDFLRTARAAIAKSLDEHLMVRLRQGKLLTDAKSREEPAEH